MKDAPPVHHHRRNLVRLVILVILVLEARNLWSEETTTGHAAAREQEVRDVVERSQKARQEIEKGLPSRKIAGMNEAEMRWAREFEELQREESKSNWFDEVDKLIEN